VRRVYSFRLSTRSYPSPEAICTLFLTRATSFFLPSETGCFGLCFHHPTAWSDLLITMSDLLPQAAVAAREAFQEGNTATPAAADSSLDGVSHSSTSGTAEFPETRSTALIAQVGLPPTETGSEAIRKAAWFNLVTQYILYWAPRIQHELSLMGLPKEIRDKIWRFVESPCLTIAGEEHMAMRRAESEYRLLAADLTACNGDGCPFSEDAETAARASGYNSLYNYGPDGPHLCPEVVRGARVSWGCLYTSTVPLTAQICRDSRDFALRNIARITTGELPSPLNIWHRSVSVPLFELQGLFWPTRSQQNPFGNANNGGRAFYQTLLRSSIANLSTIIIDPTELTYHPIPSPYGDDEDYELPEERDSTFLAANNTAIEPAILAARDDQIVIVAYHLQFTAYRITPTSRHDSNAEHASSSSSEDRRRRRQFLSQYPVEKATETFWARSNGETQYIDLDRAEGVAMLNKMEALFRRGFWACERQQQQPGGPPPVLGMPDELADMLFLDNRQYLCHNALCGVQNAWWKMWRALVADGVDAAALEFGQRGLPRMRVAVGVSVAVRW
jgi:hypothetical protein